jgi:hypothetical protein
VTGLKIIRAGDGTSGGVVDVRGHPVPSTIVPFVRRLRGFRGAYSGLQSQRGPCPTTRARPRLASKEVALCVKKRYQLSLGLLPPKLCQNSVLRGDEGD